MSYEEIMGSEVPRKIKEVSDIVAGSNIDDAIIILGYNISLVIEQSDNKEDTLHRVVKTLKGYRDKCMVNNLIGEGGSANEDRSKD